MEDGERDIGFLPPGQALTWRHLQAVIIQFCFLSRDEGMSAGDKGSNISRRVFFLVFLHI